jgi:archaemetzincin
MKIESISLISFGYFENGLLEQVIHDVGAEFSVPVYTRSGHLDLSEFYDPVRNQYDGNQLLQKIGAEYSNDLTKTLGIFTIDLFIPILTYIYGQAYLNGCCGIASVFRLKNERYGLKRDEKVLVDRFRKEVIHELGHMFGLIHCTNPVCVMRSSTYVEDIDQKKHRMCPHCVAELGARSVQLS